MSAHRYQGLMFVSTDDQPKSGASNYFEMMGERKVFRFVPVIDAKLDSDEDAIFDEEVRLSGYVMSARVAATMADLIIELKITDAPEWMLLGFYKLVFDGDTLICTDLPAKMFV